MRLMKEVESYAQRHIIKPINIQLEKIQSLEQSKYNSLDKKIKSLTKKKKIVILKKQAFLKKALNKNLIENELEKNNLKFVEIQNDIKERKYTLNNIKQEIITVRYVRLYKIYTALSILKYIRIL